MGEKKPGTNCVSVTYATTVGYDSHDPPWAVTCYMAQLPYEPYIPQPCIPWYPPTICIPQPIPDPATVEEVRKLREEVDKLRHTQEGMKKAVEKFLKKR